MVKKIKQYEDLEAIEEQELLWEIMDCINPFITDHTVFDIENGDRPTNPRWWLKQKGYDPSIWQFWLMNPVSNKIIKQRQDMITAETVIVASSIVAQWLNWDIRMPWSMRYTNAMWFLDAVARNAWKNKEENKSVVEIEKWAVDAELSELSEQVLLYTPNK